MSSIDNRIVKMGFDNAQFKQRVSETITSLGKLDAKLGFTEGIKGLGNLGKASKGVDMSSLSSSVDTVSSRLSVMEIVGVTALVNLANSAVNAGKNFAKSLTIDPITDGFKEYETKMNALQTIMTNTASKGTSMDQIKVALAELNTYSDSTIYNFAQMTDNIGKFTAAGVGLDDSVASIKGMANVAAGFGVDATRMAGATYQMSQMLASGKMMAIDWNSMVQAGMGGDILQKAFIETANSMGKFSDQSVGFKNSLEQGWLTSEVFVETMKKMAADPSLMAAAQNVTSFTKLIGVMQETVGSGWAMSWEHIFGDKDQSTALFTGISNSFSELANSMSDYRNEALKTWNETGGREAVLNGLKNILTAISKILGPIYEAFKKIIDPWNSDRLVDMSKGFEWLTSKLIISDKASEGIGKTFEALFSIVKVLGSVLKPIGMITGGVVGAFVPLLSIIPRVTGAIAGFVTSGADLLLTSSLFTKVVETIQWAAENLASSMEWLFDDSESWLNQGIAGAVWILEKLGTALGNTASIAASKISDIMAMADAFNETYKPIDKAKAALEGFGVVAGKVIEAASQGFDSLVSFVKNGMDKIGDIVSGIIDKVKNSGVQGIDIFNAGLIGTIILLITKLSKVIKNFMNGVAPLTENISGLLGDVRESLVAYQKDVKASKIQKIAVAVLLLATSIMILSKVDPDRLLPSIAAVTALLAAMMGSLYLFGKIDPKTMAKTTSGIIALIGISLALNILASALKKLSSINPDQILTAVIGLAAISVAMIAVVKTLDKVTINPSTGISMMLLAASLVILASAFKMMASIDAGTILQGFLTMSLILFGISAFMNSTSSVKNSVSVALSLIPLAIALNMLAGALAIFGYMNPGVLLQGLIVLAALLAELAIFSVSLKSAPSNMISIATGILILSAALIVLSAALGILGNMSISTLAQGMITMAVALNIMAAGTRAMPKGLPVIASGILILSIAMIALAGALSIIGLLSIGTIIKGLLTIGATLLTLGGVSIVLGAATPAMGMFALGILAIAGAIGAFGLAAMLFSVGVTAMAGSLIAFGGGLSVALTSVLLMIPLFAASIALAFVSFITILGANSVAIGRALSQLIAALLATLTSAVPAFVRLITVLIGELLMAINTMVPQIVTTLGILLVGITNLLIVNTPLIIETIMTLLISILDALNENLPIIVGLVVTTLILLITSVLDKLAESIPLIAQSILNVIITIIDTIANNTITVINAMVNFVITIISGLATSISENSPRVRTAIKDLILVMLSEFVNAIGDFAAMGGDIVAGIVKGILGGAEAVVDAIIQLAKDALGGFASFLGIKSPSREFKKLGGFTAEGLAIGISDGSKMVTDEAIKMGAGALDGVKTAMDSINDVMMDDLGNNPTITPVVDLTNIQNGAKQLDTMWGDDKSINATLNSARKISGKMNDDKNNSQSTDSNISQSTDNSNTYNTFNVTGDNPKQIASEVSKILQKQVDRRSSVWA